MFFDKHNVLYLIKQELDKSIVGYDKEKLMVFCLAMSYKLERSSGVILVGPSSGGKSNILNNVMHYFPVEHDAEKARKKNCGLMVTGLSKKVLNYFVPPGDTWNHKLLCVQELDGTVEAAAILRTLLSEGKASTIVTEESNGKHYAASFNVDGFPALFVTSANDIIESQFGNRLNVIEVPGNIVRPVLEYVGRKYGLGSANEIDYNDKLKDEISKIRYEKDVLIPYGFDLSQVWYSDTVVAQRSFPEFLKLIQCICIMHQKHRERLANGLLVANLDDYEIARRIAKISKFKLGAGLLRAYKLIVSMLLSDRKEYEHPLKDGSTVRGVTREQLTELIERSLPQIDRYLEELCDKGILKTHQRYIDYESDRLKTGRNPNVYSLALTTEEDIAFPSPKQLLHTKADFRKMRFKLVNDRWELSEKEGIPCTFHAYDPLTGKDININEDETVYMVEGKRKTIQSPLYNGEKQV